MPALLKAFRNLLSPSLAAPTGQLRIDWSHPLAVSLTSCWVPAASGVLIDLVRSRTAITSSGVGDLGPSGPAVSGLWVQGTGADTADLDWTSGPFSVAVFANLPAQQTSVYIDIFGRYSYSSEAVNAGWDLQLRPPNDSTAGVNFLIFNNWGSASYQFSSGAAYNPGDQTVIGTSDGATNRIIYSNLSKTTAAIINTPASSSGFLGINNTGTAKLYVGCTWTRQLTDNDVALFYNNPFCFLLPSEGEMPALSSGAPFTWLQMDEESAEVPKSRFVRDMIAHD